MNDSAPDTSTNQLDPRPLYIACSNTRLAGFGHTPEQALQDYAQLAGLTDPHIQQEQSTGLAVIVPGPNSPESVPIRAFIASELIRTDVERIKAEPDPSRHLQELLDTVIFDVDKPLARYAREFAPHERDEEQNYISRHARPTMTYPADPEEDKKEQPNRKPTNPDILSPDITTANPAVTASYDVLNSITGNLVLCDKTDRKPLIKCTKNRIRTLQQTEKTIQDTIQLATERGWQSIRVHGLTRYKKAIWLEAALQQPPLAVEGYTPTKQDRESLTALLEQRAANEIAPGKPAPSRDTRKNLFDKEHLAALDNDKLTAMSRELQTETVALIHKHEQAATPVQQQKHQLALMVKLPKIQALYGEINRRVQAGSLDSNSNPMDPGHPDNHHATAILATHKTLTSPSTPATNAAPGTPDTAAAKNKTSSKTPIDPDMDDEMEL